MSRWKTKIRYGYTTNGEFINTLTTETYEGPFFELRGRYYESNPNNQTLSRYELTRIPVSLNNANTKKYNELTDGTFQPRRIIQPYFPVPTESDYQNSFSLDIYCKSETSVNSYMKYQLPITQRYLLLHYLLRLHFNGN